MRSDHIVGHPNEETDHCVDRVRNSKTDCKGSCDSAKSKIHWQHYRNDEQDVEEEKGESSAAGVSQATTLCIILHLFVEIVWRGEKSKVKRCKSGSQSCRKGRQEHQKEHSDK